MGNRLIMEKFKKYLCEHCTVVEVVATGKNTANLKLNFVKNIFYRFLLIIIFVECFLNCIKIKNG